jgi:hypothetical protein
MADEDAPATKKDLQAQQTKNDLRELDERLSEQMRDMQTELLKAFLPWQDTVRVQFRELEANTGNSVRSVKSRMDVIERRPGEIEEKLLLNPPAA